VEGLDLCLLAGYRVVFCWHAVSHQE